MKLDTRRIAYSVLKDRSCERCGEMINFHRLEMNPNQDGNFSGVYSCPSCDGDFRYSVSTDERSVKITVVELESQEILNKSIKSVSNVQRTLLDSEEVIEGFEHLVESTSLLITNCEILVDLQEKLPHQPLFGGRTAKQVAQQVSTRTFRITIEKSQSGAKLQTVLHNYLASAYTVDQILETLRPSIEWRGIQGQFEEYKTKSRPIMGLRHYIQHEGMLPLYSEIYEEDHSWTTDFLVRIDEVSEMASQKHLSEDGYKNGSDYHFSDIDGEWININSCIQEHFEAFGELSVRLLEETQEKHQQDFLRYEKYIDEGVSLDDF